MMVSSLESRLLPHEEQDLQHKLNYDQSIDADIVRRLLVQLDNERTNCADIKSELQEQAKGIRDVLDLFIEYLKKVEE